MLLLNKFTEQSRGNALTGKVVEHRGVARVLDNLDHRDAIKLAVRHNPNIAEIFAVNARNIDALAQLPRLELTQRAVGHRLRGGNYHDIGETAIHAHAPV